MALDKLVDSTQLDSDLTSVANAIRTKGGTSAQLAFPAGFVSAIGDIPTGGGDPDENLLKNCAGEITDLDLDCKGKSFRYDSFYASSALVSAKLRNFGGGGLETFYNCSNLVSCVVICESSQTMGNTFARGCTKLEAADFTNVSNISSACFYGDSKLTVLVLRNPNRMSLANANSLQNTPFYSSGTGGTIYIPQSLYNHLGDGSSSDYKVATNWSTYEGYGKITWAKIEGSYYETHYADGTTIPT